MCISIVIGYDSSFLKWCSAGRRGGNISSSTSYGQPRDDYSLSVLPPVSPGRRQQKWLVDAAWLENFRKVFKSFIHEKKLHLVRAPCSRAALKQRLGSSFCFVFIFLSFHSTPGLVCIERKLRLSENSCYIFC